MASASDHIEAVGASSDEPQRFVINHSSDDDFKAEGLRPYALYRDLGVAEATNGAVAAQVIRLVSPCTAEVRKLHRHHLRFQMLYLLKGWIRFEIEGQGEHVARAGTCWTQPPGIVHAVLDYSDDCEMIEIVSPAEFETSDA